VVKYLTTGATKRNHKGHKDFHKGHKDFHQGHKANVVWPEYRRCLAGSNVLQEDLPAMPVDGRLAVDQQIP